MAAGRRPAAALAVALAVLAGVGCGGGSSNTTSSTAASSTQAQPAPTPPPDPLALPRGVPDHATGPAQASSRRVIDGWLRALRHGEVKRAAHYFALPSKFQNGTPVLTVDSEIEREAINVALPCGAVATSMGGAGAFTIVGFRLVERAGGNCGSGVGGRARGAIRVEHGKIKEWYRLPDRQAPQAAPAPTGPAV
ncbi:MAG: hypothetical protein QOC78_2624 [Solirubrobacteraceae bacterium]|jgi:hypothetical protein|nr:hypothetical protein [Solirubrobacteraceae bacterium]MEA2277664.1 hypothetical protein [Solirubrobacteraceae bacterium]MEA2396264.1 hypothetical protein [Solirubrobacteraceae bacterium]